VIAGANALARASSIPDAVLRRYVKIT
jgi:hypothetical protein